MKKEHEFTGFFSADRDRSFCFDVTVEDFIKIKGREPHDFEESPWEYSRGFCEIYMGDLFASLKSKEGSNFNPLETESPIKIRISIEMDE